MARARSPERDKAFEMWRDSGGNMKLKDIAEELGVADSLVRKWKNQDKWDDHLKGALPNSNSNVTDAKSNVTKPKRGGAPKGNKNAVGHGAPKGNRNAVGNNGGAPFRNANAVTHGLFRKHFPEEALEIMKQIENRSPIDILWDNIVIQYTAIIRAQRIMFVRDQEDLTKVLKRTKESDTVSEREWELQHAWDKHATFLQAQSRAMATLQNMIARYEEMCRSDLATEEQRLRIEKLKAEIAVVKGEGDEIHDDGFIDALKGKMQEVWYEGETEG